MRVAAIIGSRIPTTLHLWMRINWRIRAREGEWPIPRMFHTIADSIEKRGWVCGSYQSAWLLAFVAFALVTALRGTSDVVRLCFLPPCSSTGPARALEGFPVRCCVTVGETRTQWLSRRLHGVGIALWVLLLGRILFPSGSLLSSWGSLFFCPSFCIQKRSFQQFPVYLLLVSSLSLSYIGIVVLFPNSLL